MNNLKIVEPAFVGLRRDLKQRLPFYVSDYVEGLNLKCVASTLFMFFACLAPAVAFGSLLNVKTQGAMGALEMLVSTSICGMVYALFSGQPVTIIGSTGPVLAFTAIMYSTCQQFALPFLSTYAWVGLWTSGILLLCALTSTSNLVIRYLTRFTDEIFAGLISVIFVVEALKNIVGLVFTGSVGGGAALLSVMSAVATCAFAMKLSGLRTSRWFTKRVRDTVADFGPTVSIISCTAVCGWLAARYGISLEYLSLPTQIVPTTPRPWVVNLMETPVWARWGASLPAVMVSILMFFDQNITTRLVNSKDNKMKKGYGYHMDLLVVALNTLVFSMLGMPWLVAATVRSGLSIILLAVLLDSDLALHRFSFVQVEGRVLRAEHHHHHHRRPGRPSVGARVLGTLATFLASGVMHEVVFAYVTGGVVTYDWLAFFTLQGKDSPSPSLTDSLADSPILS